MKWLWLIIGVVACALAGGWYYLNNQPVIKQINRQEPGFETRYTHSYTGTFLSLDTTARTMRLRGGDGDEYLFRIPQALLTNRDQDVVGNTEGARLSIEWHDARTPARVLSDYARDPAMPLNEGTILVSIRRIDDEE